MYILSNLKFLYNYTILKYLLWNKNRDINLPLQFKLYIRSIKNYFKIIFVKPS